MQKFAKKLASFLQVKYNQQKLTSLSWHPVTPSSAFNDVKVTFLLPRLFPQLQGKLVQTTSIATLGKLCTTKYVIINEKSTADRWGI